MSLHQALDRAAEAREEEWHKRMREADFELAALRAEVERLKRDLHFATCCPEPDNCHAAQPEGGSDE